MLTKTVLLVLVALTALTAEVRTASAGGEYMGSDCYRVYDDGDGDLYTFWNLEKRYVRALNRYRWGNHDTVCLDAGTSHPSRP